MKNGRLIVVGQHARHTCITYRSIVASSVFVVRKAEHTVQEEHQNSQSNNINYGNVYHKPFKIRVVLFLGLLFVVVFITITFSMVNYFVQKHKK